MKRILTNLTLLAAALIIGIFICEITVRVFIPQQLIKVQDDVWAPDSVLGWRIKENMDVWVNTGDETVRIITDDNGHRIGSEDLAERSRKAEKSLLVLGDSFVQGFEVDNSATIPSCLARKLTQKSGVATACVNAGVRGYNPGQYYKAAKKELKRKEYDMGVVCLWIGDDCYPDIDTTFSPHNIVTRHYFTFPEALNWNAIITSMLYPFNDMMETRSHLFVLLKTRFENILSKFGLTAKDFPDLFFKSERNSSRWKDTAKTCGFIQEAFSREGAPVLFVILPTEFQVYQDIFYNYVDWFEIPIDSVDIDMPNQLLMEALESEGLPCVDILSRLREKASNGAKLYCEVDIHLNAAGCEAVAECILSEAARILQQENIFDEGKNS